MKNKSLPIYNEEAERALLGSLLLDVEAVDEVRHLLEPASFYKEAHRRIYAASLAVVDAGEGLDVVTLTQALRERGHLDSVGGLLALSALTDGLPTAAHAASYARTIARLATYRAALHTVAELPEQLRGPDAPEALRQAQEALGQLAQRLPGAQVGVTGAEASARQVAWDMARDEGQIPPPRSTGLLELDVLLGGGIERGELLLVIGAQKMGKSAFLRHLTLQTLAQGARCLYFSTEMAERDFARALKRQRSAVQIAARYGQHYTWDALDDAQRAAQLIDAHSYLHTVGDRLTLDASPLVSRLDVVERAETLRRSRGLDVLLIDHLHHLEPTAQELSKRLPPQDCHRAALKALQAWAVQRSVAVVVAAQARTACEDERRVPRALDVQECKSAAQIAHKTLALYRPSVYDPDTSPLVSEIHLVSTRSGAPGIARALWDGATTSYRPDDGTCADELARAAAAKEEAQQAKDRAAPKKTRRAWP